MCDSVGTNLLGVARNGDSLEDALAGHADGVAVVTQHVAEDHVLQRLLVVLLCYIKGHIFYGAQLIGVLFIPFELLCRETTCIGTGCINFIT